MKATPGIRALIEESGHDFSLAVAQDLDGQFRLSTALSATALLGLLDLLHDRLHYSLPDFARADAKDLEPMAKSDDALLHEALVWAMFMAAQVPALRPGVEISYLVSVSDRMLEEWRARWPKAAL